MANALFFIFIVGNKLLKRKLYFLEQRTYVYTEELFVAQPDVLFGPSVV